MTKALPRACRKQGCMGKTTAREGYCPLHAGETAKHHQQYRENRTDRKEQSFYGSARWRETSLAYRKECPTCQECGQHKTRIVHHIPKLPELLRLGRDPCSWNYLQALCWGCHEREKSRGKHK